MTLAPVLGVSKIWNLILFLHGLDIDFISVPLNVTDYLPSKVDMLRIRRSFISTLSSCDASDKIEIIESSVGFNVALNAGVKVHRSIVPPRFLVVESLYDVQVS